MTDSASSESISGQVPEAEMLRQMSAATIHNIGNVITVARLALNELEESNAEKGQIVEMLLEELLPTLEVHIAKGAADRFFAEDPVGKELPGAMRDLYSHQLKIIQDQKHTLDALTKKLEHVSEVIRLQQHLIAGLGRREQVRIDRMVEDAMVLMAESISRHGVTVEYDHRETHPLRVESPMVIQVLVNLIKNAIEALDETTATSRQIRITTDHRVQGDTLFVICEIRDNGPGFSDEARAHLFDFGFTTKRHTKGGQGVGLHFCRRTLEGMNGFLDAFSPPEGGAAFCLGLICGPANHA